MAKYAYNSKGILLDAAKLSLHDSECYHCSTPGCNAPMFPRNVQKESACFVSYNRDDHIGGYLCLVKDHFKPDVYDEKNFSLDDCFEKILSPVKGGDKTPHHGEGGVGSGKKIPITTLKMLYLMCVQFREGGKYNNYDISDILIDPIKPLPIPEMCGNHIIATTFRKYDNDTNSIYLDNPNGHRNELIKVHVADKDMFTKCRDKLYDRTHNKISVVAGSWEESVESDCSIECEITSVSKQICKG